MRNKYDGRCHECGERVLENEGYAAKVDGRWQTRCESCAEHVEHGIKIELHDDKPIARPADFLEGDHWAEYLAACAHAGTRFSKAADGHFVTLDAVGRLVKELHDRGFTVDVDPTISARLQAHVASAREQVDHADDRLAALDIELAKRGQALFPFQKVGVRWLAPKTRGLLNDEMGLGKTVQALAALPDDVPVLVVCPAIAKGVWEREQLRWRPEYNVSALEGRSSFRWPEPGEIVVTNYAILPDIVGEDSDAKLRKQLKGTVGSDTVIIADEAHYLKNYKTKRTKRFRSLADMALEHGGKAWLLTATALINKPEDLWGILAACGMDRESFSNWESFVMLAGGKPAHFGGYNWGKPSKEFHRRLHRVSLRRKRKEVLPDLPDKFPAESIVVKIGRDAKKLSNAVMHTLEKNGIDLERATRDAVISAMRGIDFEEISAARLALAIAKIPYAIKVVEQHEAVDEPLVVFSAHRPPIDIFSDREGWGVITGDTPAKRRTQIEDEFQAGNLRGVAATIAAGGTAITLTRSASVLFVDRSWTPAENDQAEDRCCRIGQTRGVRITNIVADHPLDHALQELLTEKRTLIDATVEAAARTEAPDGASELEATAVAPVPAPEPAPLPPPATRRSARNAREHWAENAMLRLIAFSAEQLGKRDFELAQLLLTQVAIANGLSDEQWRAAIELCKRHWRRVGV